MKKHCARCRKEMSEKIMTKRKTYRGLFHFYCPDCNDAIEAGLKREGL